MVVALALDVGGTKLEAGVVSETGEILSRHRALTPHGTSSEMWDAVTAVLEAARADAAEAPVVLGVGCGGPMTAAGISVSPLNIAAWRNFPLRERLGTWSGLDVAIDNDAKALALAEGWKGVAIGVSNFMAMVVSTGIGGGIVVDGRLLDGLDGNAGHVGHLLADANGPRCECGVVGCLEAMASGTAICRRYGIDPRDASPDIRAEVGAIVGRSVASVVQLLGLQLVAVAGSVALGWGDDFFTPARDAFVAHLGLDFSRSAQLVPAGLGANGPLIGAAAVGFRSIGGGAPILGS